LTENRAETLQKAKQTKLLQFFAYNTHQKIDKYWASIRICIRNDYQIEDVSIWCDYIDLLQFFNKDLHNAKYVCPADLKAEHDKFVKKKQDYLEKQRHEEAKKQAIEHEETYKEMKSKFFGIQFSDGLIQIKVLESVDEIMKEGETLHHCVFTNEYHLRPDSLLLSACINDERLETIEFSLSKLQVLQSRGVCNKNTDYHDRILKLVKKNVPQIRKRIYNKQHQNLNIAI
jgi:putative sterol carrier protein